MHTLSRRQLLGAASLAGLAPLAIGRPAAAAPAAAALPFILHAAFFSQETHQAKPLDPQVFVKDQAAQAAVGPQNIPHAAGVRPAWLAGPRDAEAFNAQGQALGFTLAEWFAATGSVTITPAGPNTRLACRFTALRPHGVYSLFENHFDQKPIGFTPLDGTGHANSFTADAKGEAAISLVAPGRLSHDNAVLLVYHSDGQAHGAQRGEIGVTAHHQIIARIPA